MRERSKTRIVQVRGDSCKTDNPENLCCANELGPSPKMNRGNWSFWRVEPEMVNVTRRRSNRVNCIAVTVLLVSKQIVTASAWASTFQGAMWEIWSPHHSLKPFVYSPTRNKREKSKDSQVRHRWNIEST